MTKLIVNCETNEVIERALNAKEKAQQVADEAYMAEKLQPIIAEAEAKATAKQAIADRLGITSDELKLLLG